MERVELRGGERGVFGARKLLIFLIIIPVVVNASYVVYGILSEPKSLNVWSDYGPHSITWSKYVFSHKYRSLYRFAYGTVRMVPDLASDMPRVYFESGFLVYEIDLRSGLKWSDGSDLTARDVEFTLNSAVKLVAERGLSGNWAVMVDPDFFSHARAVNDRTVKLYFKKAGVLRVEYGVLMAPVIQEAYWRGFVEEVLSGEKDIDYLFNVDTISNPDPGSGPFILSKWEKGAFIILNAVKDYFDRGYTEEHYENGVIVLKDGRGWIWRSGNPAGKVMLKAVMGPYVDGVVYRVYTDRSSVIQALNIGEVDMILDPSGLQFGEIEVLRRNPDVVLIRSESVNPRYLGFNLDVSPTRYKAFRKAVAYILNIDLLSKTVLSDMIVPIDSLVPHTNDYWSDPRVEVVDHSLGLVERWKRAVEILKEAGFRWEVYPEFSGNRLVRRGEGLIDPEGNRIEIVKLLAPNKSYDPVRATVAIYLESWANELGIPVKAHLMDFKAVVQKVWYDRDFDMYILGWGPVLTPEHLITYFRSDSVFNSSHYSNPTYDDLCDELLQSNPHRAREIAFEMQRILGEDIPFLPLYIPVLWEAYRKELEFPFVNPIGGLQALQGLPGHVKKGEE